VSLNLKHLTQKENDKVNTFINANKIAILTAAEVSCATDDIFDPVQN
jgi:hypothetical protein